MDFPSSSSAQARGSRAAAAAPARASGPARLPRQGPQPRPRPGTAGGGPRRLTAVGCGALTLAVTLAGGAVDAWLFGGSGWLLGIAYLVACFQAAVRVRPPDLAAAPIAGPICFALTLVLVGPSAGPGVSGQIVGLATALALHAGWLFGGTGLSAAIVLARHLALRARSAR